MSDSFPPNNQQPTDDGVFPQGNEQPPAMPPVSEQPAGQPNGQPGPNAPMNTLSIVGFILAFIVAPVGAILGHVSLSQIKKRFERGRGLAIAAIIIGWVATAIWLLTVIGIIVLGTIAAKNASEQLAEYEKQVQEQLDEGPQTEAPEEDSSELGDDTSGSDSAAEGETPSAEFCSHIMGANSLDITDEAAVTELYENLAATRGDSPNQQIYQDATDAIKAKDDAKFDALSADLQSAITDDAFECAMAE